MVAAGKVRGEDQDHQGAGLRRLFYKDLLERQKEAQENTGETFVRFMPNGRLPEIETEIAPPEVSQEEIHQRRMEEMERQLYQKVYAEAEKAGLEIGEKKMDQEIHRILPQLEGLLRELDGLPGRVFAAAERFLIETVLTLTRELLAHELSVHPEKIAHRIQRVLKQAAGRNDIVIHVAPEIYTILEALPPFQGVVLKPDAGVLPGSVVMESDFGGMEDLLEEQLHVVEVGIRALLQGRLESHGLPDIAQAAASRTVDFLEAEPKPLVHLHTEDTDSLAAEQDPDAGGLLRAIGDEGDGSS